MMFSLEKLVFDDELCGQALHFCRDCSVMEDLPTVELVRELLEDICLPPPTHSGPGPGSCSVRASCERPERRGSRRGCGTAVAGEHPEMLARP
jgi:hypothetical protein